MRNKGIGKQALSILLCALVVFSSLGISPLTPQAQAEEAAAVSVNPDGTTATDWSQIPTTNWNETDNIDIGWYVGHTTETDFTLSTPEELAGMMALSRVTDTVTDKNGKTYAGSQTFSGKTIKLGSDMDLGAHVWQGIGQEKDKVNSKFKGTFDGQGYVISNVWMSGSYTGFFDKVEGGVLKNIIIDQSHYKVCAYSGALIGLGSGSIQILNCKVANTEIMISGNAESRVGGIAGQINRPGGVINNCTTENVWIKNDGTTPQLRHVALIAAVFSGASITNCTVSGGGILLDDTGKNNNYNLICVGSIYANLDQAANSVTGNTSSAAIRVKGITRTNNDQSINIGGLYGSISTSTTYSCFTGTIEVEGCTTKTLYVGGLAGTIDSGKSVSNCYNAGSITVKDSKSNNSIDLSQNVAGVVGNLAGNMSACYNAGTITGLGSNATSAFGGLTGRIGGSIADCFYINAVKASGDDKNAGAAINLASIQDTSGNVISQIKQGDDTAKVVLADATQLSALQKADALGVSFGIQMPTASAFSSNKPEAVQAVVGNGNTVNLKTSGGAGGQAAISAKMYLNQNELATDASGVRKFTGPVKSVEAPIILNLNVVNVGLANQSPTSAIGDVTSFSLKAGVTFGGTGVSKDTYSLKWYKSTSTDQSTTPTDEGVEVTGLTETWDKTTNTATWKKTSDPSATFATDDTGWYKLKATSAVSDLSAYSFETDWQYLSVDRFMVVDENSTMPDTVELSSQDTDIQAKTKLSVKIKIADSFKGSVTYGWYKVDGQPPALVANTKETTTKITADIATHTITEEITLGTAYSNDLKGTYQLMVTSVTDTGGTAQKKDIRGPASKVTCYEAVIKDDYAQAGPGYEGTPGNTMTQSVITLSEDFADAMYDAYWIKGGTLSESTDLTDYTQVRHATLTQQENKTYKAIATFNMEKGYEGNNYQLVIYPTNTARIARADTAMQFKGASGCVLERYAIDTVTYTLADSYATTEMTKDNAITAAPSVSAPNPSGSLTYTKVSGPEAFTVDKTSGKILCAAEPKDIPNGLYTYTIKVTEEGFKNDTDAVLTGPGMSKTITVSFRVTGSSDFPLANNNLYIYDSGYIFADAKPTDKTKITPYQGIYNIPADNNGTAYAHSITVVSGTHTDGSRIILNESINTADVPITVEAGATAQVGVPDGQTLTLTNSNQNGASLQSDGSLRITGGTAGTGSLTLPGKATGNGSLTIGAADTVGLTLNAAADLATDSATIESGQVNVTGSITGKATIKGGNVKANAIGKEGATTIIDGGSIIGSVTGEVKNSEQERVYPVTLKLSENPTDYAGVPASVTTQKTKADGKADGTAKTWNAQASGDSFNKTGGQTGELYVYLPQYSGGPYTAATATPASGTAQTLSRKINADADGSLSASLLTATYTLSLPKAPITGSAKVGHGATANITVGVANDDGWLYEGRTIDLEISPGDGYKTIWGKYQMQPADTTAQGSYSPEFWIETPSGAALSKAGGFATLAENDRQNGKTGQLVVPADSKITEGTYKSQLNWKSIPNDPVVGGTN